MEPHCTAHISATRDVRLELPPPRKGQQAVHAPQAAEQQGLVEDGQQQDVAQPQQQDEQREGGAADTECDPIQLAIFSHR